MARHRGGLFLAAVLALLAIVGVGTAGALSQNRVSAILGDREVIGLTRHAFSDASLTANEDALTLTLGDALVTVTRQAVILPSGQAHPVPEGCRRIEVRETTAGPKVAFDGVLAE